MFKRNAVAATMLAGVVALLLLFGRTTRNTQNSPKPAQVQRGDSPKLFVAANQTAAQTIQVPRSPGVSARNSAKPANVAFATNTTFADGDLSENVKKQIAALQADKDRRTPTQNKIDSQLLFAAKMGSGVPITTNVPTLQIDLDKDADGRILVDITAQVTDGLLRAIESGGGKLVNHFAEYDAIRAWMPLSQIEPLASRPEIKFIRPAARALTNVGTVLTEGDNTHRAGFARTNFNVTGSGVKIGVLSDSVDYLANSQSNGNLGTVTVLTGRAGSGEGEGTAMLEIIHDLAPGAQLFFATGSDSPTAFAQSIRDLRFKNGCDIIVDDLEYVNESPFQDAVIAKAVTAVVTNGALYFSAASNSGNVDHNSSSTWEGDFVDGGAATTETGRVHSFGSATQNPFSLGIDPTRRVDLFWADPLGASSNDYDVYVLDSTGTTVVATSNNRQSGRQDPYEGIAKIEDGQRIVIVRHSGSSRFLHLEAGRGKLAFSTTGRTKGHSAVIGAMSVAAVSVAKASYTNPFVSGAKNPVEDFSSDGPRRVFFNADGTAITPGDFSSTGGTVRQKPDITAADGVSTSVPNFSPFYGTSAAAPHAAAIAALIKSYNPTLTAAQITAALTGTALDIQSTGWDRDSGFGIVMADLALSSAPSPAPPTINSLTPGSGPVGSTVVIAGSKFSGVTQVAFNGASANFAIDSASQITATVPLSATTGFVTITSPGATVTSPIQFTVTQEPLIASFTPLSGPPGNFVTISGANFTGATDVSFNGTSANFTVVSSSQISVVVPQAAATGRIVVTTPNGTASSPVNFIVTALPQIVGFSPASAGIGSSVMITGANFNGLISVKFNGAIATATSSDVRIDAIVPSTATTGPITVTTTNGSSSSASTFEVLPTPVISSFTPASGPIGASVTISGFNFGTATSVLFGSVSAAFSVNSANEIVVQVPDSATTSQITVVTDAGSITSTAFFTVVSAPPNDNFAMAQILTGTSGSVSGTNIAATKESGEPSHAGKSGGKSIWYRWTAPGNGVWTFDTVGSTFDTTLAVYTGTNVTNLVVVASNDDYGSLAVSSLSFLASSGTEYSIAVDGFNNGLGDQSAASGNVVLRWSLTAGAPVITGFTPTSAASGSAVTITGANFTSPLTVKFNGTAASGTFTSTSISVTVPTGATTGPITVATSAGTAISQTNFTVVNRPANDTFANAIVLPGGAGSVLGTNLAGTRETSEPIHAGISGGHSIWYRWVAPSNGVWAFDTKGSDFDTIAAVYAGTLVSSLSVVSSNDDSGSIVSSALAFTAISGREYRIAIDGAGGATGSVQLNWTSLGNLPYIATFGPLSGGVNSTVTLIGANFTNVTQVAFNGVLSPSFSVDSAQQIRAIVPAGATNGTISVSTTAGEAVSRSTFTLTDTPANDNFASGASLVASSGILAFNSLKATRETGEPKHAGNAGGHSLWYNWIAPSNGVWTFDTSGTLFDTTLTVYRGNVVTNLSLVASNDDWKNFDFSLLTFTATSNTLYRIAIDGFNGAGGVGMLRYQPALQPLVVYNSSFNISQGYVVTNTLAGQQGWIKSGTGGNGVVSNYFTGLGGQGYIGFTSGTNLVLERPFNYTPDLSTQPTVQFSVTQRLYDSTNFRYDHFQWRFINLAGQRLFDIDFNNNDNSIGYQLDGTSSLVRSTTTFNNSAVYSLVVSMDFQNNRWNATFGGKVIATNQPITTVNAALDLRSVAVAWVQTDATHPGNNYLVFDDYTITADTAHAPAITSLSPSTTIGVGKSITLSVLASGSVPMDYQWSLDGSPIPNATNALLTIQNANVSDAGTYSVTITNSAGGFRSSDIVLTVQAPTSSLLISGPTISSAGEFEFRLNGDVSTVYTIQSSLDLISWSDLTTVSNRVGEFSISDTMSSTNSQRFYRVLSAPAH